MKNYTRIHLSLWSNCWGSVYSEKEPSKLVSLNVDSLDYEVLSQLTFLSSTDYIRYIEWSSDTRYVLFELWEMTGLGPGYILERV